MFAGIDQEASEQPQPMQSHASKRWAGEGGIRRVSVDAAPL